MKSKIVNDFLATDPETVLSGPMGKALKDDVTKLYSDLGYDPDDAKISDISNPTRAINGYTSTVSNAPNGYQTGGKVITVRSGANDPLMAQLALSRGYPHPQYKVGNGPWNNILLSSDFVRGSADLNTAFDGWGAISMYNWNGDTLHTPQKDGLTPYGNGFAIGFAAGAYKVQVAFVVGENRIFMRSLLDGGAFSAWVAK